MDVTFEDEALRELYETGKTKDKKYKHLSRNKKLIDGYIRVAQTMYAVSSTRELRIFSFLHYEQLRNDPRSSVRLVNGMIERLLFIERDGGVGVLLIEIDSTHYGNK